MRIAICHDWPVHYEQEYTWRDGLAAAIRELAKRHEVKFWVEGKKSLIEHPYFPIHVSQNIRDEVKAYKPDVILMWGDLTRPNAEPLSTLGRPMALCFAGGAASGPTLPHFDHIFVESQVYFDRFSAAGRSVSRAFGTNTELFTPMDSHKHFDAIFPATFAAWKRHNIYAEAVRGLPACAVGYMIPNHEEFCWKACEAAQVLTLPHVSAETLHRLMGASKTCVITSHETGGSQRTVLEALSMNLPVIVMEDSDKTSEYVRQAGGYIVPPKPDLIREAILNAEPQTTRQWVLDNYSEYKYAADLETGLLSLCS